MKAVTSEGLLQHAFPEPGHDHARCAADAIAYAEQACRERGERFTPTRRSVLEALLSSHRPLGAYDVIELLARRRPRPAPITIYRALDFLIEQGLVHRIVSRNAFLACVHNHDEQGTVAFLICEGCSAVAEIPAGALAQPLVDRARTHGFAAKLTVVEIAGTCAHCARAG